MTGARRERGATPPGRESVRFRRGPAISVVVVSTGDATRLRSCIGGLRPQCEEHDAELIVVTTAPGSEVEALVRSHPWVRFVSAEAGRTLEDLKSDGMAATTGDVVGIRTDETDVPDNYVLCLTGAPRAARRADAETLHQEGG
ncbi:MAG: glycosyltransferase family 2 protein [Gemmatimonadota bacterium]